MAWVIEGNLCKTPSKFRNFHGRPAVIVSLAISKRTKVDIYSLKARFLVLLVGFPIANLLFSIKGWGKKVKLGQF